MNPKPAASLSLINEPISFEKSGFFSPIVLDYLALKPTLIPFYHRDFSLKSFGEQMAEKSLSYLHRNVLTNALIDQYQKGKLRVPKEIELLRKTTTFTVTTGHQVSLFTGPAYFIWKILSVIRTCQGLKLHFPEHDFIPVFWMATEDHDFEEANHFVASGYKFEWESGQGGAVGRMNPVGIDELIHELESVLGIGYRSAQLIQLFRKSYLGHSNIADATRFLVDTLFSNYGLLVVDGDDVNLKRLMIPAFEKELLKNMSYKAVSNTNSILSEWYDIQVNPREINLFYLKDDLRERIISEDEDRFGVYQSTISWNRKSLIEELHTHPERFSPNVILRPLYQETILPNLAYAGGGGELAYWLQLKGVFNEYEVPYPILILRNSVLFVAEKADATRRELGLSIEEAFENQDELLKKLVKENSSVNLDFGAYRQSIEHVFLEIDKHIRRVDIGLERSVKSGLVRADRIISSLEAKMLRAEKRKQIGMTAKFEELLAAFFPNGSLQERYINFSDIYLQLGPEMMDMVLAHFKPFETSFNVLISTES